METWLLGPPLLVGERIIFRNSGSYLPGTVKWLGRLQECFGNQMVAGLALDEPLHQGGGDGSFGNRRMFQCHRNHAIFTPLNNVVKFDDFMFVNPGYPLGQRYTHQEEDTRRPSQHQQYQAHHQQQHHPQHQSPHQQQHIHNQPPSSRHFAVPPSARPDEIHYQNHFFTTIRDSSPKGPTGAGFDPFSSFRTDEDSEEKPDDFFDDEPTNFGSSWSIGQRKRSSQENLQPPSRKLSSSIAVAEDIMQRLEEAISVGNHREAARLAKEVSKMHITAKLTNQELSQNQKKISAQVTAQIKSEKISLRMYVEDQASYNGPFTVNVIPSMTLAELKKQIECQFEIPVNLQKWILDKTLANNDDSTLASFGINKKNQNIYLYLVTPEKPTESKGSISKGEVQSNPEGQSLLQDSGKAVPEVPVGMENRKGRYWNYEHNRWSYCEDSDDEEEAKEGKTTTENKDTETVYKNGQTETGNHTAKANEPKDKQAEVEVVNPNEEDEIYEWEYYYEDAELKKDETKPATALTAATTTPLNKLPTAINKPIVPNPLLETVKATTTATQNKTVNPNPKLTTVIAAATVPKAVPATKAATTAAAPTKTTIVNGWECPSCTLMNEPTRPGCAACATDRPKTPDGATANLPADGQPQVGEQKPVTQGKNFNNYKMLDDLDIIPNIDRFECVICFLEIEPGDGVVLRECLHNFCKECLSGTIENSDSPQVGCPYKDDNYSCDMVILEREIKALVSPAVYEKLQQKSLKEAQANSANTFQCKTPDCNGWCFVNDNINSFKCPLCNRLNCITCQAIHEGQDCKQYQLSMLNEAQDENSVKTKIWIDGLIATGEALKCPSCQVILLKKWGCDWVRCTYCRTEICWVTRQLRWGPNGKGDTSGGCKCMADGRTKCHPLCNYCH